MGDCCYNVFTIFKNILMFDIKTLMSFYEKKKKKINFKLVFMVLPLAFNKDLWHLTI
jgi:hypothetical protein